MTPSAPAQAPWAHSLLHDPMIHVQFDDGVERWNLPMLLAHLSHPTPTRDLLGFVDLQTYQRPPWHFFLAQVMSLAARDAGWGEFPLEATTWTSALTALTGGDEHAWCMVVADVSKPAFMQPPIPEGSLEDAGYLKTEVPTADDLDMLITSKNHDLKSYRMSQASAQQWMFSLLSLQTMEGWGGRGNYGIARMNGSYGSRPMVGLTPDAGWHEHVHRDAHVLKDAPLDSKRLQQPALLWMLPWDGGKTSALTLPQVHPHCIELCRRIRFIKTSEGLTCLRTTTDGPRLSLPEELNGPRDAPWSPVDIATSNTKGPKSLSISGKGFDYILMCRLLGLSHEKNTSTMIQNLCLRHHPHYDGMAPYVVCRGLARGQSKTEGYHERILRLPQKIIGRLLPAPGATHTLAKRSTTQIEDAQTALKILRTSILVLLGGGQLRQNYTGSPDPWVQAANARIDEMFFEHLWAHADAHAGIHKHSWLRALCQVTQTQFELAQQSVPIAHSIKYRALSAARRSFYGAFANQFPDMELWSKAPSTSQEDS